MNIGCFDGRHYTEYVQDVKLLIKQSRYEEAEKLLIALIEVVENESRAMSWGVAPWYYEKLAILYRKQRRKYDEIAILERFASQKHAPGSKPAQLLDRLKKLIST